jgi:hypothetical protein
MVRIRNASTKQGPALPIADSPLGQTKRGHASTYNSVEEEDDDGISGLEKGDVDKELIPVVIVSAGRPPAPSKAELQFGHHITKSISKHYVALLLLVSMATVHVSTMVGFATQIMPGPAFSARVYIGIAFGQHWC